VAVLGALLGARKPQTADQIAAKLSRPAADRVTVYRTLEAFLEAGLVHKAFIDERTWHFELAHNCTESQCHPHFTCTDCGDTNCLTEISLPLAKSPGKGFVIRRQRVQLEGLCPKCNANSA
jgi:Fur family ferric uptake transcriptional regulator